MHELTFNLSVCLTYSCLSLERIQIWYVADELLCLMLWLITFADAAVLRYSAARRVNCRLYHGGSLLQTTDQMLHYIRSPLLKHQRIKGI